MSPQKWPNQCGDCYNRALDDNLPLEVPGAAVTILTLEGKWFETSGVSDLENNIAEQILGHS
ncbi:MAG: hypothetical protein F6K30_15245 [Cyanothece sp. SIO2G6]|nr:hypothetical protein [Cyanothece sp. SIO2G6]